MYRFCKSGLIPLAKILFVYLKNFVSKNQNFVIYPYLSSVLFHCISMINVRLIPVAQAILIGITHLIIGILRLILIVIYEVCNTSSKYTCESYRNYYCYYHL